MLCEHRIHFIPISPVLAYLPLSDINTGTSMIFWPKKYNLFSPTTKKKTLNPDGQEKKTIIVANTQITKHQWKNKFCDTL